MTYFGDEANSGRSFHVKARKTNKAASLQKKRAPGCSESVSKSGSSSKNPRQVAKGNTKSGVVYSSESLPTSSVSVSAVVP